MMWEPRRTRQGRRRGRGWLRMRSCDARDATVRQTLSGYPFRTRGTSPTPHGGRSGRHSYAARVARASYRHCGRDCSFWRVFRLFSRPQATWPHVILIHGKNKNGMFRAAFYWHCSPARQSSRLPRSGRPHARLVEERQQGGALSRSTSGT